MITMEPERYHIYTRVKRELVEDAAVNIEMMVGRQLGRTMGRTIELAYAQGRGAGNDEPDGWNRTTVVGDTDISGASNARRITTAAANQIAYDDIAKVAYAVDDFTDDGGPAALLGFVCAHRPRPVIIGHSGSAGAAGGA